MMVEYTLNQAEIVQAVFNWVSEKAGEPVPDEGAKVEVRADQGMIVAKVTFEVETE